MAELVQEHNHATGETGDQVPAAPSIFGIASDSGVSTDTVNTTRLSNAPRVRTSPATARYAISTSNGYDLQRDSPMNTSYILKAAQDTCIEAKKTGIVEAGLTVYLSEGMFMHIEDHRRPMDKFQSFKVLGGSELFNLDTARSVMSDQTDEIPTAIPDSKIEEMNSKLSSIIPNKDLYTSCFLKVNEDELSSFLNSSVNETDNNGLQANNQESLDTQKELPSSSSTKHTGEYELVSDDDSTSTDLANTDLVDYLKKHKYFEDDGSGYDNATDTEDREDSTPATKRIILPWHAIM
ncbi:unnamed protein product [Orchesella dallaii]|uniref:Uncharacterized protein n=1 Tax=Orchesella dallaii TaxID=48710 RepID=A0ABP1PVH3_9HEXA